MAATIDTRPRRLTAVDGPMPGPGRGLPTRGLGLSVDELEELLVAVGDREDQVGEQARARLARGRMALERELAAL